jgi:hypothetical protein
VNHIKILREGNVTKWISDIPHLAFPMFCGWVSTTAEVTEIEREKEGARERMKNRAV